MTSLINRLFHRSRVVHTTDDVRREFRHWIVPAVLTAIAVGIVIGTAMHSLLLAVLLAVVIVLSGYMFGPLSYVLAPIMLPLGGEYVLMDRSFGIWGWVFRPVEGDGEDA